MFQLKDKIKAQKNNEVKWSKAIRLKKNSDMTVKMIQDSERQ